MVQKVGVLGDQIMTKETIISLMVRVIISTVLNLVERVQTRVFATKENESEELMMMSFRGVNFYTFEYSFLKASNGSLSRATRTSNPAKMRLAKLELPP